METVLGRGTLPNIVARRTRERLSAERTYYVRTDGSDGNTGLDNSAGGAFLTIQKAIDVVASLDCSIYNVTIQLAAGTYVVTSGIVLKQIIGSGQVVISGDTTTPSNVVVDGQGITTLITSSFNPSKYSLRGFKIYSSTSNVTIGFRSYGNSYIDLKKIDFGAGISQQLRADYGGYILVSDAYTISGGAAYHIFCATGVVDIQGRTVTISGTPAFSSAFLAASNCSVIAIGGNTYSGSATGVRYSVIMNSVCDVAGGGANYLPGNSAGSTATGGQYA